MNAQEYADAAWKYWGYEASELKPDITQLSDDDLYQVSLFDSPGLPTAAEAELTREWDNRRLRVKVYRDNSPVRKKR